MSSLSAAANTARFKRKSSEETQRRCRWIGRFVGRC